MKQAGGQFELGGGGEAQPDPGAQFDEQFSQQGRRGQFHLHEAGGGPGFGLGVPPSAESSVVKSVPAGERGGRQPAGGKGGEEFGALRHVGARPTAGMRSAVHAPEVYHAALA